MHKTWSEEGWNDYLYWQSQDRKTLKKINDLLKDIERNGPDKGIGKPEPLKYLTPGAWSRRLTLEHRIVYLVHDERIDFLQARYHY